MNVDDCAKGFLEMSEKDQMEVLKKIMPVFCKKMSQNPGKAMDMFSLFTEECGTEMKNMVNMMGMMMGGKGGGRGCCG